MAQVIEFKDYVQYLAKSLGEISKSRRGVKTEFASRLQCHPAYLTRVLSGKAHLSLEQADRANQFLGHMDDESRYFLLLVEYARAGTMSLKRIFEEQIVEHQQAYLSRKKSFKSKEVLSEKSQNLYYSSWQYGAIMVALTVPGLNTKEALSSHFKISPKRVSEIIEFLSSTGLIQFENGKAKINAWPHLSNNSPLIARDHANWRLMAIRSFENHSKDDLYYSSVVSLSKSDFLRIKKMFFEVLDQSKEIVRSSKEETVCSILLDVFEV